MAIFVSLGLALLLNVGAAFSQTPLNEFISTTCSHIDDRDIEGIIRRNYSHKFPERVNTFLNSFRKYRINNQNILSKLKAFKPEWQLNECSLKYGETDSFYRNWEMQVLRLNNNFVNFLPTSHFAGMTKIEIQEKMKFLNSLNLEGKTLLLEGFEFHEQISCSSILKYALTKKNELVTSEHTFMLHKAFWEGIPVMGADNQRLQEADFEQLEAGAKEKNDFLYTHRILSRFVSQDSSTDINQEKMNRYILDAIKISKLNMTLEDYKLLYESLNKRKLPNSARELQKDFYPVEIQNLETNRLVERIQEVPRNKALLSAMEFVNKFFGPSLVIYGAYHYGVLRDELFYHSELRVLPDYCK